MRCFFNLVSAHSSIPDSEGFEVADMEELRAEVSKAIEEMRHAEPAAARTWNGWRMEVTDPAGVALLTVNLDRTQAQVGLHPMHYVERTSRIR